jgi:hypothetical protein
MTMADQVEETTEEVRGLAKDYFGLGDSEGETLMKLAKRCAMTSGIPVAGAGGVALAGVGSVAIPLIGSVPGYVAGALAGFIGGTTACMIARRSTAEHVKQILSQSGISDAQFKQEVRRLVSLAHGKAGFDPKANAKVATQAGQSGRT